MLADFRTLGLIEEENQLHSNLLREKETDEFWDDYFSKGEEYAKEKLFKEKA
jgi:hypothetical protein